MRDISSCEINRTPLKDPQGDRASAPQHSDVPLMVAARNGKLAQFRPRLEILPVKPIKIAIKTKGKILLINPAEILTVEAQGNYVLLQLASESYHMRESISAMAEKLLPYGFIRIHRSVLVNSSCVEEIHPGTSGEYMLRIVGGREYLVSRTYKLNLKSLAQSWIGTDPFVDE